MFRIICIAAFFIVLSACQGGGKLIAAQIPENRSGPYRDFQDITTDRANADQVAEQDRRVMGDGQQSANAQPAYQLPPGYRVMTPSYNGQQVASVMTEDDLCQAPESKRRNY